MMNSEASIQTFHHSDGSSQRVQIVRPESWKRFSFLKTEADPEAFDRICRLYQDYIVPRYAWIFGKLVLFRLPDDIPLTLPLWDERYGMIMDRLAAVSVLFQKNIHYRKDQPVFLNEEVRELYSLLKSRGCLTIAQGKLPALTFLPVRNDLGFLSRSKTDATVKVNSSFFVMDRFDCMSPFDVIGTPIGLCLHDNEILNPPLFDRELLSVDRKENVSITRLDLKQLSVRIDDKLYRHGENATFCCRPQHWKTPAGGFDITIIGRKVIACKDQGNSLIPASGFVLHLDHEIDLKDPDVSYQWDKDLLFAIQVGNSAVIDGKANTRFTSSFYDIRKPWTVAYPPSFYPLNYEKDRAPRIVLGADSKGKPLLLWFEGAGKFGHEKDESSGASLKEAAIICERIGMANGIHLDGGGSAQILIRNERFLRISDRDPADFHELERAIPNGIAIL